jgi:hypothetical protein
MKRAPAVCALGRRCMGNSPAQREREFVAWIKAQRQIPPEQSQLPFVVARRDAGALPMAVRGDGDVSGEEEAEEDWARRVPDGLIVGSAVLGACIGCPIGSAAGGVVAGFVGGFVGALLGELAVLGVARLLKVAVRGIAVAVLTARAILQSLVR